MQESSKYQLNEGQYKVKTVGLSGNVYVIESEDSVKVYPLNKFGFDSANFFELTFPQSTSKLGTGKNLFIKNSFDLDVLSILFKYRHSVNRFPNQFTSHLNGAAYIGHRSDIFKILYKKTLLYYKRRIEHYGYSFGAYLRMGATAMNPWVTEKNITQKYDGFVITKGVA